MFQPLSPLDGMKDYISPLTIIMIKKGSLVKTISTPYDDGRYVGCLFIVFGVTEDCYGVRTINNNGKQHFIDWWFKHRFVEV